MTEEHEPQEEPEQPPAADPPASDDDATEEEEHDAGTGDAASAPDDAPPTLASAAIPPSSRPGPQSQKEVDKAIDASEKEASRHANRLSEIFGEDAQLLHPCPRCAAAPGTPQTPGFIFPLEVREVPDGQKDAVLVSMGAAAAGARQHRPAQGVERCPQCDGLGQLAYPTDVEHVKLQNCARCGAQGYVAMQSEQQTTLVHFPAPTTTTTTALSFTPAAPCSRCGSPGMEGQPHFCNPQSATG